MRRLTILVAVLAGLYGGYWFIGSSAVEKGARQGLAGLEQQGVAVSYADLSTVGFPSRFDTTITDAKVLDPKSGYGWAGPFLQVFALSYQPNKVIVIAPPEQTVITPTGAFKVTSDGLRASGSVGLSTDAPLTSAIVESGAARIVAPDGSEFGVTTLLAAVKPTTIPLEYGAYLTITGLALPATTVTVDSVLIDALATLDRPLDRHLSETNMPQVQVLTLTSAKIRWGGAELNAAGQLSVSPGGYPEGQISITVTGWQTALDSAVAAGLIKPEVVLTYQNMGTMLANGSTDIALPLKFENGRMALGPFPLGPAPRLR